MHWKHLGLRGLLWAAIGLLAVPAGARAESADTDWPQFRGPMRDGISREAGLASNWPEQGPRELWRVPLGDGYSAISVVGNRLYTMYAGEHEGEPAEFVAAFDADTGKELWKVVGGERHDTEFGNGPRSTPTVVGDTVYVLSSKGDLAALKAKDGTEIWKITLKEAFGTEVPVWGFAMSPLVDGPLLLVLSGGGEGKEYAGIDRKTGEVKWTSGDGGAGYNSPIRIETGGETRYVYIGSKLRAIDGQGREVWSHDWPRGETHASPVFVAPDRLYASGAEGIGAEMVRIEESDGKGSVASLWKVNALRNHFSTAVHHEGYIYGFDNATFKCVSAEDGSLQWARRRLGKGSLMLADGHLFVLTDDGELLLVEATPEEFREKGRVQALEGRTWTAPSLSNGRLYLRSRTEMVAYDVKDRGES